jgi:hypothetical protein
MLKQFLKALYLILYSEVLGGKNVLLCSFLRMRQKKNLQCVAVLWEWGRWLALRVKSLCCPTVGEAQVHFIGFFVLGSGAEDTRNPDIPKVFQGRI